MNQEQKSKMNLSGLEKGRMWNKGKKRPPFSAEWRKKLGDASRGEKHYLFGKKVSEEICKKISQTRISRGIKHSEDTKKKIGFAHSGEKNASKRLEVRKKISEKLRGENHPQWRGGVTRISLNIRDCFAYRQWHSDILTRDKFVCQICGSKKNLEVDHIKQFALILKENVIRSVEDALRCPELWNINNGRTLCRPCHLSTPTYAKRLF